MSAIMNFAIFPLDKGDKVGEYVSQVVAHIKSSGFDYQFSPMGTVIEAPTVGQLLQLVDESYRILEPVSDRVYCTINIDFHKNKTGLISKKTESIEKRIGGVKK